MPILTKSWFSCNFILSRVCLAFTPFSFRALFSCISNVSRTLSWLMSAVVNDRKKAFPDWLSLKVLLTPNSIKRAATFSRAASAAILACLSIASRVNSWPMPILSKSCCTANRIRDTVCASVILFIFIVFSSACSTDSRAFSAFISISKIELLKSCRIFRVSTPSKVVISWRRFLNPCVMFACVNSCCLSIFSRSKSWLIPSTRSCWLKPAWVAFAVRDASTRFKFSSSFALSFIWSWVKSPVSVVNARAVTFFISSILRACCRLERPSKVFKSSSSSASVWVSKFLASANFSAETIWALVISLVVELAVSVT